VSGSRIALLSALALAVLAGCGSSPSDQVRSTLRGFADATAKRDYQALCDDYFSPALVDQVEQAGLPCEAAIRPEISATRNPKLDIRSVDVNGDHALAKVHTSAANQPASDDTIQLLKVKGKWRIASLAQTGPQPSGAP
jgi:ketosteroid isomerase-like protein